MKLLRFGTHGHEQPGMLDEAGHIRDLSGQIRDIRPETLAPSVLTRLKGVDLEDLPLVRQPFRIGPPVRDIGKIVAVGLNYSDHAAEAGMAVPAEPVLFMKATTAISGPYDPVVIPPGAEKVDWEVELGIVIGSEARRVSERRALEYVAGYTIVNDVSERSYQLERGGQWVKGKSCDTFAPIGPYLVTTDEVPDPQNLSLWLEVNGVRRQEGHTSKMIFPVAHLVSYISHFMTLMPGDVIITGTPPGVGAGHKPPIFLKPGDVMRLHVEGLGEQQQEVVAAEADLAPGEERS